MQTGSGEATAADVKQLLSSLSASLAAAPAAKPVAKRWVHLTNNPVCTAAICLYSSCIHCGAHRPASPLEVPAPKKPKQVAPVVHAVPSAAEDAAGGGDKEQSSTLGITLRPRCVYVLSCISVVSHAYYLCRSSHLRKVNMADAATSSEDNKGSADDDNSEDDTLPLHAVAQRGEGKGAAGRGGRGRRRCSGRGRGSGGIGGSARALGASSTLVPCTGLPSVHTDRAAFVQTVEQALAAMHATPAAGASSVVLTEAQRAALEVLMAADLPARFLVAASLATSVEPGNTLDATGAAEWLEGLSVFAQSRVSHFRRH